MGQEPSGLGDVPAGWNRASRSVSGAAIEVHSALGPGLLERPDEHAMIHELRLRERRAERQVPLRVRYKGVDLGDRYLDLVVEELLVVERKSVDRVREEHPGQSTSYLRSSDLALGLLINFNVARLKDGLRRRVATRNTPVPECFLSEPPPRNSATSAFSELD
jgi:GxxExxY protein